MTAVDLGRVKTLALLQNVESLAAGDAALPPGRRQTCPARRGRACRTGCSRMDCAMLLPQKLQRHPRTAQLAVDHQPLRL